MHPCDARPAAKDGWCPQGVGDMSAPSSKKIGVGTLVLINICAVVSLRNFPNLAIEGWSMIFWYMLFGILLLVPLALVSSELGSTWPESGGFYSWVGKAFPKKGGFISIWSCWIEMIVWYPAGISFLVIVFTHIISNVGLGYDPLFMGVSLLVVLWGLILFNILFHKYAANFARSGTVVGTIIPMIVLVILTIAWVMAGNPSNLPPFSMDAVFPSFDMDVLTFAGTIVLVFGGIEMIGFYLAKSDNPKRIAAKAAILSSLIIVVICILGTWCIATVLPIEFLTGETGINGGMIESLHRMLTSFNLSWLIIPLGIMLLIGITAQMSTLIDAPARGFHRAYIDGELPKFMGWTVKDCSPIGIFITQGVIGTFFILIFVLTMGSDFNGYWILLTLSTLLICLKNALIMIAFIKLRYTMPDEPRPFVAGEGKKGIAIAVMGVITVIFGFVMSLMPPKDYGMTVNIAYILIMIATFVFTGFIVPAIISKFKKDDWKPTDEQVEEYNRYYEYEG